MIGEPALAAEVDHALRQGAGRLGLAAVAAERHRDVERVQLAAGVTQPLTPVECVEAEPQRTLVMAQMPEHERRLAAAADARVMPAEEVGVRA